MQWPCTVATTRATKRQKHLLVVLGQVPGCFRCHCAATWAENYDFMSGCTFECPVWTLHAVGRNGSCGLRQALKASKGAIES